MLDVHEEEPLLFEAKIAVPDIIAGYVERAFAIVGSDNWSAIFSSRDMRPRHPSGPAGASGEAGASASTALEAAAAAELVEAISAAPPPAKQKKTLE